MTQQLSPALIKELRDRTGVGMAKCKEALAHTSGDIEEAIAHLRKSGMASAVKKESRETKEGLIFAAQNDKHICLLEVNAETDFVAKNDLFQEMSKNMLTDALEGEFSDLEAFKTSKYSKDPSLSIDEYRAYVVQTLGENLQIKRLQLISKQEQQSYAIYSHMGGKILSFVAIEGSDQASELAKELAMHVAAEAPEYLNEAQVPESIRAQEEEIAKTQAANSGKPDFVIQKIVDGKLNSYYDQNCLLRQKFIKDSQLSITALLEQKSKELSSPLKIKEYLRWTVGS